MKRYYLTGCPVDDLSLDQTVEQCLDWIAVRGPSHHLAGINANNLVIANANPQLAAAYCRADLVQPDGVSILLAAEFLGAKLHGRVNGTDLMVRLIEEADRRNLGIYFFGSKEEIVAEMVRLVTRRYPGVRVAGYRNGYFEESESTEIAARIGESGADILFVGLPTPMKEFWVDRHLDRLNTPVVLGVGGSFDVFAGFKPRAAPAVQRLGLEWVWRLLMEPRRLWRRYLIGNLAFLLVIGRRFLSRLAGKRLTSETRTSDKYHHPWAGPV